MTAATGRPHRRTEAARSRLRLDIASGRYSGADMLPGERDLAAALAVSRTTLRRLLSDLVEEGLLRHRQGVGTFILRGSEPPPDVAGPAARLPGFVEAMAACGVTVATAEIARSTGRPTPEEAMLLGCSPTDPIIRLVRLRLADSRPLALERACVPCRYITRPEEVGTSLYATLERLGSAPIRALQRLQIGPIGPDEAAHLGVAPGSPGALLRRTAYLASGTCCEFTRTTFPADRYETVTESRAAAAALGAE